MISSQLGSRQALGSVPEDYSMKYKSLSDAAVKNAKGRTKPYKLSDGKGLYLLVQPSGGKYWRFDFSYYGKRKTMSLGIYPVVKLAKARKAHEKARELVADGINPIQEKKREEQRKCLENSSTFEVVALELIEKKRADKISDKYLKSMKSRLERYIFPHIGYLPIAEIDAPDLLDVLKRIESTGKLETCQRIKRVCGEVFRFGILTRRCSRDPAADLTGALATGKVTHMATITDPKGIAELLRAIDGYSGQFITLCALKLAPLLFVRPGELRHAEWNEIDIDGMIWRIPAGKMKMRAAHTVPLSRQAAAILKDIQQITGKGKYVFPSLRSNDRPMSENTVNAALRRLGYSKEEMTGHGFRGMASTNLNEQGWSSDVIERQLAHSEKNSVRAAYNHAEYLPQRKKMMQAWADYLNLLKVGKKVIPIRAAI